MHFSPKSLQNRFTFGHILSREVTWSIKNHTVKMVIQFCRQARGQCVGVSIYLIGGIHSQGDTVIYN